MNIILSLLVVAGLNSFILFSFMLGMKSALKVGWGKEEFLTAVGLVAFGEVVFAIRIHENRINTEELSLQRILSLGATSQGIAVLICLACIIVWLLGIFRES